MRLLIAIPVIHTQQDMGSLLEQIKQEYIARFGLRKWTENLKSVDEVWDGIRQMIQTLQLPMSTVQLYQDGLPVCSREADIVGEVAASGSKNHRLLIELVGLGAQLMGTENPELLLQEYQLLQTAMLGTQSPDDAARRKAQRENLLRERDDFIAQRINATLVPGNIGLLFLGMAHDVEPFLEADILVRHLLPALREKQAEVK